MSGWQKHIAKMTSGGKQKQQQQQKNTKQNTHPKPPKSPDQTGVEAEGFTGQEKLFNRIQKHSLAPVVVLNSNSKVTLSSC